MSSAIPIRTEANSGIPLQFHRESFAHSQGMGGISWGGASVGSWLRDEVLMATKDSHNHPTSGANQPTSMSFLTGSAVSDTMAGGTPHSHGDGGGLLAMSPNQHSYFPSIEADFCRDYSCCGHILPTLHDLLRHYEEQHISPSPPDEPPVMRRMQNMETVSTNDVFLPFDQPSKPPDQGLASAVASGAGDSNRGIGSLDTAPNAFAAADQLAGLNGMSQSSQPQPFAPPSFQPLHTPLRSNGLGATAAGGGLSGASANLLGAGGVGQTAPGMHNAGGTSGARGLAPPQPGRLTLGDDDEPTIDDPARQLYILERSENKPFKCPVIGCEKTYKNQNGLKYHRQHGHQNQTLHLNDDGTYSIIDPLSNTPYPDGMGMEKDKPYRCEICGKRYKNLNGLKYHRAHSTH